MNGVMAGIFAATGQSCMAGSRVLVQDAVFDRFCDLLADRGSRMIAGDPLDPQTQLGPLPFGGFGQSGTGREMGAQALDAYTETKGVWIDTGNSLEFRTG